MSTNELNIFLNSFGKPANYPDTAWHQVIGQSRQVWQAYLAGEDWQQKLDITCKESYLMLVDKNGKLIVSDESLLNYVKNAHVANWLKLLEEVAFKAIRDQRFEVAERYFGKALKLDAASAVNHYRRALVRLRLMNHKGALLDLSEAIRLKPELDVFYVKRAEVYRLLDIDHKALGDLNTAINLNPKNDVAYEVRGKYRLSLGDRAGSRMDLLKAEELRQRGQSGGAEFYGKAA